MFPTQTLPRQRTLQLSVQQVGQETLIYDEQTHKAYCLNPVAAAVWNRCDGSTTAAGIAVSAANALGLPITEELVQLSLVELQRDGLLDVQNDLPLVLPATISRRSMMVKLGISAAILLPAIAVVTAPAHAQAYNGCVNC